MKLHKVIVSFVYDLLDITIDIDGKTYLNPSQASLKRLYRKMNDMDIDLHPSDDKYLSSPKIVAKDEKQD